MVEMTIRGCWVRKSFGNRAGSVVEETQNEGKTGLVVDNIANLLFG